MKIDATVVPYKGRKVDPKLRVEVYRNLNRKSGVWYSVRQKGHVVGHTKWIYLKNCYFVVHESGRQRVLKTGKRNVHAYVLGYIQDYPRFTKASMGISFKGKYNPREMANFNIDRNGVWEPVIAAMQAELSIHGLSVWMPRL